MTKVKAKEIALRVIYYLLNQDIIRNIKIPSLLVFYLFLFFLVMLLS